MRSPFYRTYNKQNTAVMKKFLKITAWVLGLVLLLVAGTAAYVNYAPAPTYDPPTIPELKVEVTTERIEQGRKLASMLCVVCHNGKDGKLSGQQLMDAPKMFGKIYSKNITQSAEKGIGKWTDGQIYTFLRTGLRKDGTFNAIMPKFPKMADEDIYSIIAWLHSDDPRLQPSDHLADTHQLTMFSKALLKFVFKPYPMPAQPVPLPDTMNQVEWGLYLANSAYGCYGCHSADFSTNNDLEPEKSKGFYAGGNPMLDFEGNVIPSANITPDEETGIGKWSQDQFVQTVRTGKRPDGTAVRYPMLPHSGLTDNEVKAIYAYLRTVSAVKNDIKNKK